MLVITIVATSSYQYALQAQARAIQANVSALSGCIVLVTDALPCPDLVNCYRDLLPPDRWQIHHLPLAIVDGLPNYEQGAQLCIAQMRTAAFCKARALGADLTWSLDSDVLPPANAFRCMVDMLGFDQGYYQVATCPYPSQGGGGFLFGRGTQHRHILDDIYEDEREVPEPLAAELGEHRAKLEAGQVPDQAWVDQMQELEKRVKELPPVGNVFALNAKRWRRRGWGEAAYPAIGKGSVVPTDWCGFGCTLLNRQALMLADFCGYEGKGTEDLFVVWRKWHPAGLRICAIPHVVCSHVIRQKDRPGYKLIEAFHETEGECVGHIRQRTLPWIAHSVGEVFTDEKIA